MSNRTFNIQLFDLDDCTTTVVNVEDLHSECDVHLINSSLKIQKIETTRCIREETANFVPPHP